MASRKKQTEEQVPDVTTPAAAVASISYDADSAGLSIALANGQAYHFDIVGNTVELSGIYLGPPEPAPSTGPAKSVQFFPELNKLAVVFGDDSQMLFDLGEAVELHELMTGPQYREIAQKANAEANAAVEEIKGKLATETLAHEMAVAECNQAIADRDRLAETVVKLGGELSRAQGTAIGIQHPAKTDDLPTLDNLPTLGT